LSRIDATKQLFGAIEANHADKTVDVEKEDFKTKFILTGTDGASNPMVGMTRGRTLSSSAFAASSLKQ